MNRKGKVNGAEFDNVRIIVQKGKRLVYTEDTKKLAKVTEFKELVNKAKLEHKKTPVALIEETLPDIPVTTDLEQAVVRNSTEDLEHFIDEEVEKIRQRLNNAEEVISYKELRDLLMDIPGMNDENLENGGLETQKNYLKEIAENSSERKAALCRQIIKLCELKEDEIRLRTNQRPKTKEVQSMVEEEAQQNDLTRFERFKQWAKRNLGGISVVAISVAGIITTIVMGARTVIKKGARATSKFARALAKVGEKVAPVIGGLLNLAAKLLTLSADAVGFLAKNLWLLAVAIAYILYKKNTRKKVIK